jgi:ADP-dependent NAD(P)H-hydrate dehydratase / NAD(P)H-hydrate epimerase
VRYAYDVQQVRAAEQRLMARLPEGTLMQRAAAGLATVCATLLDQVYGGRVVLLVGSGDNGGDALFAGARLARRGARVDALLLGSRSHEAGLAALRRAGGRVVADPAVLDRAGLVLDGIIGIGGRGGLRPDAAALARRAERGPATIVAVDVPSGVDASTGVVEGEAVRADVTVTFGALKPGLLVDPGAAHAGVVELVEIGLDLPEPAVEVLQADDVAARLPAPGPETDKYRRGVLGVRAGSDAYTGAAVLCVGGAVRGGAGMVRYSGPDAPTALVRARWPEVVVGEGRVQAWAVGSGLDEDTGRRAAGPVLASDLPAVVDAGALRALGVVSDGRSAPTLATPHAGELARLLAVDRDDVEARRLEHARRAARDLGVVVLLKGSTTVVARPDGRVRVNPTGTPALATAGTGDVLAGLCGALLAGGLDPFDAGSVGAWLHGLAGRLAAERGAPIVAHDVIEALPGAFRTLGN